jgi:hypothetical protein
MNNCWTGYYPAELNFIYGWRTHDTGNKVRNWTMQLNCYTPASVGLRKLFSGAGKIIEKQKHGVLNSGQERIELQRITFKELHAGLSHICVLLNQFVSDSRAFAFATRWNNDY